MARVHPTQPQEERREDVMSALLLASVNSATFSRTSNLNHSSTRMERRKSLELINNDPVWDLNDQDNEEVPKRLSHHSGFEGGELLDNEDSDIISGMNTKEQYKALNASPTKNKKFIKTLDSRRLHQDRIRRNSGEVEKAKEEKEKPKEAEEVEKTKEEKEKPREEEEATQTIEATEMKSDPVTIMKKTSSNFEKNMEKNGDVEERKMETEASIVKSEVAVTQTIKSNEKTDTPSEDKGTSNKLDPEEENIIQRGSTGDLEI